MMRWLDEHLLTEGLLECFDIDEYDWMDKDFSKVIQKK